MTTKEIIASELEQAVRTLDRWQYHPNVNLMTPQEVIGLVKSVLNEMAENLRT